MSIQLTKAYIADGKTYASLGEAQIAEITAILSAALPDMMPASAEKFAEAVVERADAIVDVLTTTPSSRPPARKVNGGRKPRKPKAEANPDDTGTLPLKT